MNFSAVQVERCRK